MLELEITQMPGLVLQVGEVETQFGSVWVAAGPRGLRVVTVPGRSREECLREALRNGRDATVIEGGPLAEQARKELTAYFEGRLQRFTVPLDPVGTDFQRRVWAAVAAIPYGETATYRQIAERIGQPRAVRAVGAANGANPLAIIIPCHRVVGSDGSLTGYGGGLAVKRALLDLEARCRGALP